MAMTAHRETSPMAQARARLHFAERSWKESQSPGQRITKTDTMVRFGVERPLP